MSASEPRKSRALLNPVEAECIRLEGQDWKLVLELNIRTTIALASTLAVSLRLLKKEAGQSVGADSALLEFIIKHLSHSQILQEVIRTRADRGAPESGASNVPN